LRTLWYASRRICAQRLGMVPIAGRWHIECTPGSREAR